MAENKRPDEAKAGNASALNEMSKVRELLFGQLASELETRIDELEARLVELGGAQQQGNSALENQLSKLGQELSSDLKGASDRLSQSIDTLERHQSAALDALEASQSAALEAARADLGQELNEMEAATTAQLVLKADRKVLAQQLRGIAAAIDVDTDTDPVVNPAD